MRELRERDHPVAVDELTTPDESRRLLLAFATSWEMPTDKGAIVGEPIGSGTTGSDPSIAPEVDPDIAQRYRAHAKERGYHFSSFEWLATRDPGFERSRLGLVESTYTRSDGEIPTVYRELIVSGVLAFRGYPSLKRHLERALREGATVGQVVQMLELAAVPGGMPVLHFGLDLLVELEREQPELFTQD